MVNRLSVFFFLLCANFISLAQNGTTIAKIDSALAIPFDEIVAEPSQKARLYESLLPKAKEIQYEEGLASLYAKLSLANYYLGNYDISMDYSLKAVEQYEQIGDLIEMGNQLCETGYMMKRRDLDKAFEYMRKGLAVVKKSGDENYISRNYNNFGVLHEMKGNIDSALHYYFEGLEYVENAQDSVGLPYSLNNIFEALLLDNQPDSALPFLQRSMEIRQSIEDELGITENHALFGDYYFKKKQYQKAIQSYQTALERTKRHEYLFLMQYCAEQISKSFEQLNKPDKALEYFKRYAQYKDSLTNSETNKAIANLEIRYETAEKEKAIAQQKVEIAEKEVALTETAIKIRKRNEWLIGLAVALFIILLTSYYIYKQQRLKQAKLIEENRLKDEIAQIKLFSELQEERLRISRDLHDNIGSQLTFIISSLDNLSFLIKKGETNVSERIARINRFAQNTIAQFRDTIWAMNREQITIEDLQTRLLNMRSKMQTVELPELNFNVEVENDIAFNGAKGMNIYRVLQEAVNNAIKYAKAEQIDIKVESTGEGLQFSVIDEGKGFDMERAATGNGLSNMKRRAKDIGGELKIVSSAGKGTKVFLTVPLGS